MAALDTTTDGDAWSTVLGQERAVTVLRAAAEQPVHAYLLVGPRGSGKLDLARAFAAEVLAADPAIDDPHRARRLALGEKIGGDWLHQHPDITLVEPDGASIRMHQAEEIVRAALLHPTEGSRKVMILTDFHLVLTNAGPPAALLKTIEEPPPSTVFVILAEEVPAELVTIASRCIRIEVGALPEALVRQQLEAEGIDATVALDVAGAAGGDLRRARDLASDEGLAARRAAWASIPSRVDGTGATVAAAVDELLGLIEQSSEPVKVRHLAELEELDARAERYGEKVRRKPVEEGHKRELRQIRAAELRFGIATLAGQYTEQLTGPRAADAIEALAAIQAAGEALIRNPNEALLLQALFLKLPGA